VSGTLLIFIAEGDHIKRKKLQRCMLLVNYSPIVWNKTVIEPSGFRMLLKYLLGMPLFSGLHKCPDCGKQQDKFGHHVMCCKVASGAIDKHNSIVI
jgi:hypothetical protein